MRIRLSIEETSQIIKTLVVEQVESEEQIMDEYKDDLEKILSKIRKIYGNLAKIANQQCCKL